VIMLVNIDQTLKEKIFSGQWKLALVLVVVLAGELGWFVTKAADSMPPRALEVAKDGNVQMVADSLFKNYLLPFEIASILLLVAMVGAVVMAKRRI